MKQIIAAMIAASAAIIAAIIPIYYGNKKKESPQEKVLEYGCDVELVEETIFFENKFNRCLSYKTIDSLLDLPEVPLLGGKMASCKEAIRKKSNSDSDHLSNWDIAEKGNIDYYCKSLHMLRNSEKPKYDFLDKKYLANLKMLPASIIGVMNLEETEDDQIRYVGNSIYTFLDEIIIETQLKDRLVLGDDAMTLYLTLHGVSDFNSDGYADMLVSLWLRAKEGSHKYGTNFILTKIKADNIYTRLELK